MNPTRAAGLAPEYHYGLKYCPRAMTMPLESKTAFQLQQMIGEMAGFHPDNIDVVKLGNDGGFRAVLIGHRGGRQQVQSAIRY